MQAFVLKPYEASEPFQGFLAFRGSFFSTFSWLVSLSKFFCLKPFFFEAREFFHGGLF